MNLLKKDGSICFILPYDFTFVTYGKPLWEKLFNNFKKIEVHHTKKDTSMTFCKIQLYFLQINTAERLIKLNILLIK